MSPPLHKSRRLYVAFRSDEPDNPTVYINRKSVDAIISAPVGYTTLVINAQWRLTLAEHIDDVVDKLDMEISE